MSQTTTAPVPTGSSAPGPRRGERAGRLPRWAPLACFLGAAVLVGVLVRTGLGRRGDAGAGGEDAAGDQGSLETALGPRLHG